MAVRRDISKRSHEKIEDCEQSILLQCSRRFRHERSRKKRQLAMERHLKYLLSLPKLDQMVIFFGPEVYQ